MPRRSNPFDHAQSDWLSMQDELDRANEETRQAKQVSIQLLAEVAMLKADLATANKDLRFWRTYGVRIETRLEVMQEVITSAREEAREHAREEVAELPKPALEAVLEAPKVVGPLLPNGIAAGTNISDHVSMSTGSQIWPQPEVKIILEPSAKTIEPITVTATFDAFNGSVQNIQQRLANQPVSASKISMVTVGNSWPKPLPPPTVRPVRELWSDADNDPESFDGRPRALTNNWP